MNIAQRLSVCAALFLSLITKGQVSNSRTIPDTLQKIATSLSKGNRVESMLVGEGGSYSTQWTTYEALKKLSTAGQLIELTDHMSPIVRCYSFLALSAKYPQEAFAVILNHLNDTSMVLTMQGCILDVTQVGDFLIDVSTQYSFEEEDKRLNEVEAAILDSVLLAKGSSLHHADALIKKILLKPCEYEMLRTFAERNRNTTALVTLAKYQNPNDRALISSFFKDERTRLAALYAAREFPDASFYPLVKEVFEMLWRDSLFNDYAYWWKISLQALARYPRTETIELFERIADSQDEEYHWILNVYLMVAARKYPDQRYDVITEKIKLTDHMSNRISKEILEDQ